MDQNKEHPLHENHRARMQARVDRDGLESLAEHEALEYLLFLAIPRKDTNALAHRLIQHFGNFCKVMEADPEELMRVEGIGAKSARVISTVMSFSRYYELKKRKQRVALDHAEAAVEYLCSHGCINEERDAQMLAETLANRKLYGKNRIRKELFAKGFEEAVIRGALDMLDIDFAELCARRIASMGGLPCFEERAAKQKAIAALMRYGFSYDDIREGTRRLSESE